MAPRFLRNIGSNVAGYFVSVVIAFLMSPYVVRTLGDEVFGLWTVVTSLTGYYGLLDLGVKSAVGQYLTRYWAKRDLDGVNRTLSTSLILLSGVAALGLAVTLALPFFLDGWVAVKDPGELRAAQWALVITGVGIVTSFPLAVYSTVAYSRERFDVLNVIGITERVVSALLSVGALASGWGIVGLAAVTTGVNALGFAARIVLAYHLMPGLRFAFQFFTRDSVRELVGFGLYNFLVNAASRVAIYTNAIVLAGFLSVTAVTYFTIGGNLIPYYLSIVTAVTWTFTPYATSCDARGDREALRRLLLGGTRGTLFLASVLAAGIFATGHDFLGLWMGWKYVSGAEYPSSALILTILTWSALVRASQSCGHQILHGTRRIRYLAKIAFLEAVLTVALSIALVRPFGLIGVAVAALVPIVLLYGVAQAVYVVRLLDVRWGDYLGVLLRASAPVMLAMWGMSLLADRLMTVDGWSAFLVKGLLIALPVAPVGYLVVMTPEERRMVVRQVGSARALAR